MGNNYKKVPSLNKGIREQMSTKVNNGTNPFNLQPQHRREFDEAIKKASKNWSIDK